MSARSLEIIPTFPKVPLIEITKSPFFTRGRLDFAINSSLTGVIFSALLSFR